MFFLQYKLLQNEISAHCTGRITLPLRFSEKKCARHSRHSRLMLSQRQKKQPAENCTLWACRCVHGVCVRAHRGVRVCIDVCVGVLCARARHWTTYKAGEGEHFSCAITQISFFEIGIKNITPPPNIKPSLFLCLGGILRPSGGTF